MIKQSVCVLTVFVCLCSLIRFSTPCIACNEDNQIETVIENYDDENRQWNILDGLMDVEVHVVMQYVQNIEKTGVSCSTVQKMVEEKLTKAGINIDNKDGNSPVLYIKIGNEVLSGLYAQTGEPVRITQIQFKLVEKVSLLRRPQMNMLITTWRQIVLGYDDKMGADEVLVNLDMLTSKFLSDYFHNRKN